MHNESIISPEYVRRMVTATAEGGKTALHIVVENIDRLYEEAFSRRLKEKETGEALTASVSVLVEHGALVTTPDIYGSTPLHIIARSRECPLSVSLLVLERIPDADTDLVDETHFRGRSVLHSVCNHLCSFSGPFKADLYIQMLTALLKRGANPLLQNALEETPRQIINGSESWKTEWMEENPDFSELFVNVFAYTSTLLQRWEEFHRKLGILEFPIKDATQVSTLIRRWDEFRHLGLENPEDDPELVWISNRDGNGAVV